MLVPPWIPYGTRKPVRLPSVPRKPGRDRTLPMQPARALLGAVPGNNEQSGAARAIGQRAAMHRVTTGRTPVRAAGPRATVRRAERQRTVGTARAVHDVVCRARGRSQLSSAAP
ncbi:hypothetical protein FJT64_016068 [Amphibalanus amphitrite]|uniref:Uncharacterized protein n=1 Tax=Amphibalanus amphitrite TaxID=1232801 RepID=A0A6A4X556_AMPAM|nr:hypothetical protein FJT64_016068 [Amphibalanus amphitrite]